MKNLLMEQHFDEQTGHEQPGDDDHFSGDEQPGDEELVLS